jgi:hypothetical protein
VANHPPPGSLGFSAPNAMFYVVDQGIFQACLSDGAVCTDFLGDLYTGPIAWKECPRVMFPALSLRHPAGVQHIGPFESVVLPVSSRRPVAVIPMRPP